MIREDVVNECSFCHGNGRVIAGGNLFCPICDGLGFEMIQSKVILEPPHVAERKVITTLSFPTDDPKVSLALRVIGHGPDLSPETVAAIQRAAHALVHQLETEANPTFRKNLREGDNS